MNSLFIKIFLWFWLAVALTVAALTLAIGITDTGSVDAPTLIDGTMKIYSRNAFRQFETQGISGLSNYVGEIANETDMKATLIDENGVELIAENIQKFPEFMQSIATNPENLNRTLLVSKNPGFFVLRVSEIGGGKKLAFYTMLVKTPFDGTKFVITTYALRILFVLLTAGILCYLLALYIASPISKIRNATQQLADGDLSVRVSPIMGRRRDELAGLARDFDGMAAKIESLMSAQWRLLRDISHELRSPLARLNIGVALARKRANAETNQAFDRIEQESAQMNEMVNQLLELDRWEFATEEQPNEQIDLGKLLGEIVSDADFEARNQNRKVTIIQLQNCTIKGVPSLIRSAIENVVRNALRHTDEATSVEIQVYCENKNGTEQAVISVQDQGAGVPESAIKEIFQPFFRVDDARDREQGGTGLGLAITERAVRLHQGTVTARNEVNKGFIVEIRLPAKF